MTNATPAGGVQAPSGRAEAESEGAVIELAKIIFTGVLAAALTVALTWIKEILATRKVRIYSSMQAAVTLESFALSCSEVLSDYSLRAAQGGNQDEGAVSIPSFPPFPPFPSDIDWKSISSRLMAEALTMKNDVELSAAKSISFLESVADDEETALFAVEKIAEKGLTALDIAERLRTGLPPLPNVRYEREALKKSRNEARHLRDEVRKSSYLRHSKQ